MGSKVTDALGENFERHDKIAKIHQGVVNGGCIKNQYCTNSNSTLSSPLDAEGEEDEDAGEGDEAENGEDSAENGEKEKNGEDAMEETEEKAESDVEGGEKEGEDKSAQVGIYVHIKDPELQGAGLDCFDR